MLSISFQAPNWFVSIKNPLIVYGPAAGTQKDSRHAGMAEKKKEAWWMGSLDTEVKCIIVEREIRALWWISITIIIEPFISEAEGGRVKNSTGSTFFFFSPSLPLKCTFLYFSPR